MKKKLLISTLIVILILSMTMAMLVGCKKDVDFGPQVIGEEKPDIDIVTPINSGMSGFEMLQAGMDNYYNAEVAIARYNGNVGTKVVGVTVNQLVESTKIRVGKGDAEGNNAYGASYFADNRSYSIAANLYEKMIINEDEILYKNAKKGETKHSKNAEWGDGWKVGSWNGEEEFDSVAELAEDKSNNPTILWMYDLQAAYVLEGSTAPALKDGVYTFTLKFDPIKSTANYIETMRAQLEVNAGMGVEDLVFEELNIQVEMWENGAIKRLYITESYKMKMDIGIGKLNSSITLYSDTQYAYAQEEGFKLEDHVKAF